MRVQSYLLVSNRAKDDRLSALSTSKCREMKARQCAKIKEIGDALRFAGYVTLDEQALVLGLGRSTTWAVLQADHKASGLSAAVINRMLAAPRLPPTVSEKILEYVNEKASGLYGHSPARRRRFVINLSGQADERRKQAKPPRA
jgi:hypothetical protein